MAKKQLKKKPFETVYQQQAETAPWQVFPQWTLVIAILLGLLMFFGLGWLYQTTWYWYYSLPVSQLDLPLSLIFGDVMVVNVILLILILIICSVLFVLRLFVLYVRNFIFGDSRIGLSNLFSIRDFFERNIHLIILLYIGLIYFIITWRRVYPPPPLTLPPYLDLLEIFTLSLAVILFIRMLGDLLSGMPTRIKHRLRLKTETGIDDGILRIFLGIMAAYAISAAFTGLTAVEDASIGFQIDGGYLGSRRVYVESDFPIAGLDRYRKDCDCNSYIYGPMGFLAENKDYIFLIPWKADNLKYFEPAGPLYQIERSPKRTIDLIPFAPNP